MHFHLSKSLCLGGKKHKVKIQGEARQKMARNSIHLALEPTHTQIDPSWKTEPTAWSE